MKYLVQYSQLIQILKRCNRHCLFTAVFLFFFMFITADSHIQIGRILFSLPAVSEIVRCGITR